MAAPCGFDCDNTNEPCGMKDIKSILQTFQKDSSSLLLHLHDAQNATCHVPLYVGALIGTYAADATVGEPYGENREDCKNNERRRNIRIGAVGGSCPLGRRIVFLGQVKKLGFDRLPVRRLVAVLDFTEGLCAEIPLVPTLGPSQPVEQSVEFRFAKAGARPIPAAFGSFLLGVVPFRTSSTIESQFDQTQNHHQVPNHLGLVKRTGEGSKLNSILTLSKVGQIQKVVAIRFASALGIVFVAILFNLFGVGCLFAFPRTKWSLFATLPSR